MADRVASLVFGCANLGMAYGLPRQGETEARMLAKDDVGSLIDSALALGIDTFDTAPAYGESERRLGATLGARGIVWTKTTDPHSLATSLERLNRPRIDLLQWHNWTADRLADRDWLARWRTLREHPQVGALGATTYGKRDAVAAVESGLFSCVQVEFNLFKQSVVDAVAEQAKARSVRIAVRSVYLQGALTDEGRALPPFPRLHEAVERARALAQGNLSFLALRTALEHPAIDHILIGIDRLEQLQFAVETVRREPLPTTLRTQIRELDQGGHPDFEPLTWLQLSGS